MPKQKKSGFREKDLIIRISLTAVLAVVFFSVFFAFGGVNLILNRIGEVKCFADYDFEVHYIDVGQGDSTFIRFPDGSNMLIDAGPSSSGVRLVNYLSDLFKQEGIAKIDRFLFTHQDSDHIGGAPNVFATFQVDYVYRPMVYCQYEVSNFENLQDYNVSTTSYYNKAIIASYNEPNCKVYFSKADIEWGNSEYSVKFLSPNEEKYSSNNAYSPIVKVVYKSRSFLFTGDAESVTENEVIKLHSGELKADVLKVAHHGGKYSSSAKFLAYVSPKIAIISVGKNNSYGHPTEETLGRIEEVGATVYQTAIEGSIALSVDGDNNIIKGGVNNQPDFDLTIVIVFFIAGVLVVWGVRPIKQHKKAT